MKGLTTTLTTLTAVGLLAGSSVGVAAQEAEQAAPVEVTGTAVEGACPGGPSTVEGSVDKTRGYVCRATWSMSDPRLDGTFTRAWNLDWYLDGTGMNFGYATGQLETDGGAWLQRPGLRAGMPGEPELFDDAELLVFDGKDAYEGLLAIVFLVGREDGNDLDPARLHGYIVEDTYPPSDLLIES